MRIYNDSDMVFAIVSHSAWERMLRETEQPAGPSPDRSPLLFEVGRQLAEAGHGIAILECRLYVRGYFNEPWFNVNHVTCQVFSYREWLNDPAIYRYGNFDEKLVEAIAGLTDPTSVYL